MQAFRRALRSQWLLPFCVAAALPLLACSSGSSSNGDAAVQDLVVIDYTFGDLPPGCPPAAPNNVGVGSVCTKGGGECQNGLICACDTTLGFVPPDNTPCICTRFKSFSDQRGCGSLPAGFCGEGAICCSYMNAIGLCVPTVCLENAMCPVLE